MSTPSPALAALLKRLVLERAGPDVLVDPGAPSRLPRVFGGQAAAQALAAMGATVQADRPVHSVHVSFAGLALPLERLVFTVTRPKEGSAFDLRTVTVTQRDRAVLTATASFQEPEAGPSWQQPLECPAPDPASLPRWEEAFAGRRHRLTVLWHEPRPLDLRFVDPPHLDPGLPEHPRDRLRVWWRADGAVPDDPLVHACLAVYAADTTLLETALLPHGTVYADGRFAAASLNHALWFHSPLRADGWLLHDQRAVASGGSRGLATSSTYDSEGRLVATAVQEGLLRECGPEGAVVGLPVRPSR